MAPGNQENVAPPAAGGVRGAAAKSAAIAPPLSLGKNKRKQLQKLINVERTHVKFTNGDDSDEEEGELVEDSAAGGSATSVEPTRAIFSAVHLSDDFPYLQHQTSQSAASNKRRKGNADVNEDNSKQVGNKIGAAGRAEQSTGSEDKVPAAPRRDYESLPLFSNRPVVGQVLAYKLLELSQAYTPEISEYKEATVIAYDTNRGLITLRPVLAGSDSQMNVSNDHGPRKFDVPLDEESAVEDEPSELVILDMGALLDARIVSS
ncbi:hypothetical protein HDU86_003732 [Geranomyces michiganensis]|nr:hypothetical protein HDU86_003732 [Geranomyces michiganensis]